MIRQVFRRTEVKYLLSPEKQKELLRVIKPHLQKDEYFKGTNCSIYFDTATNYLAMRSLEHPLYKEKFRLRSYGVPTSDDIVFLEIKKKFDSIGSKRRVPVKLRDFEAFIEKPCKERMPEDSQIFEELLYSFERYQLQPSLFLAYDRIAYTEKGNLDFRLTFDSRVRSRTDDLKLESGDHGELYFQNGEIVMEVKALNTFPLWFVRALSSLKIYPSSFSKYGRVMQRLDKVNNKKENYV